MAKYFIEVVRDSPRTGLSIPVKTKKPPLTNQYADTRPLGRSASRANQGRNKNIPSRVDADSQVRPRRRTARAGPDAISTSPRCCRALHAHRVPSSSSPG